MRRHLTRAPRFFAVHSWPRSCLETLPSACRSCASAAGEAEAAEEAPFSGTAFGSYGARFLRRATGYAATKDSVKSATSDAKLSSIATETVDPELQTRLQIQKLFRDLPGQASLTKAYFLHSRGKLKPVVTTPLDEEEFETLYKDERRLLWNNRRKETRQRRNKRRNYFLLNPGYVEEDDVYEAEEEEFSAEWRLKSIVEDCWKAEYHSHLHRLANQSIPERQHLATRTDRISDVLAAALRNHVTEQNRPVLTHELADYDNPYMTKRSTMERVLVERCVRNQLDERCLPRVLDQHQSLVKLRSEAKLPPEVLEPLAAFRGDVRWHSDASERLTQKLGAVDSALEALVVSGGDASQVSAALPENAEVNPDQVPGVNHPWKNHLGFESAVPRGVAGGTYMGRPMDATEAQILKLRYPTLQRVAHTMPSDPKWRAHVARSIQVLERSKNWDFKSKLRAVNTMKEIYDNMRPSTYYTEKMDEKMPVNRVPSHLKRKYARQAQYVKTYPKKFMKKKSHEWYRASLTARNPKKKVVQ